MVRHGNILIDEINGVVANQLYRMEHITTGNVTTFPRLGVSWYSGKEWSSLKITKKSYNNISLVVDDPKKWLLAKLKYEFLNNNSLKCESEF